MTSEQLTAILGALTALVVAVTALVVQVRQWRKEINGHVTELLSVTAAAAKREGELAGRDWAAGQNNPAASKT